jgi:hypothetical protein
MESINCRTGMTQIGRVLYPARCPQRGASEASALPVEPREIVI